MLTNINTIKLCKLSHIFAIIYDFFIGLKKTIFYDFVSYVFN